MTTKWVVRPEVVTLLAALLGFAAVFLVLLALVSSGILVWWVAACALVALLVGALVVSMLLLTLRGPKHVRTRISHDWVVPEERDAMQMLTGWFAAQNARVVRLDQHKLYVRVGHRLPSTVFTRPDRLPAVLTITAHPRPGAATVINARSRDDLRWTPWHSPELVAVLRRRQRELLQRCVAITTSR
ncbi:hypothetical protein GWK18_11445 [Kocuria sp. JC486]|uniref:Uncharacterized protein n=1 Tax=Kocuria soli TaxID=2485125 RepID=A0A3N3ZP00_9MICC|nr:MULTISPECIES: hypothetical protein [Kocuria]NHU86187.1 hypothetical protein [Kocuria sp. JC486]ROZ61756.1 hypothetical protein EDL96_12415 [Kocuria soli]